MVVGSGVGAFLAAKKETAWGTYTAPSVGFPGNFNLKPEHQVIPVGGYAAAGRFMPTDEIETLLWGTGHYESEVLRDGMGMWLQHIMGGNATPVQQAATTAYLQTHVFADNYGKGLTVQVGAPTTAGTQNPFTGYGGKSTAATFSCAKGESLKMSSDWIFKKVDQVQTAVSPSYTTTQASLPFNWTQMSLKLGTYASEASVQGVKGVSVSIARGMNADDAFYAGNSGYMSEPVWSASDFGSVVSIAGTVEIDNVTKADFIDRFFNHSVTSLVWDFTGPIIASTYAYAFTLTCPKVYFDTSAIDVSGAGVISASVPFTARYDTTNGYPTLKYMSVNDTGL